MPPACISTAALLRGLFTSKPTPTPLFLQPAAAPQPGSPLITSKLHPASSAPSHLPSQPQQGQRLRAPGQGLGQLRGISAQLRRLSEQLPQVLEAASQRISAHVAAGSGAPLAAAAELQQAPPPAGKLQGFGSRLRRFSERLPQVLEAGSQRIGARMGSSTSAGVEVEVEQASGLQRLGARLRRYSEQMLMPAAAAAEAPGESGQPAGTELRELRGHRPAGHAAAPAPAAASGRVVDIHVYAGCVANLQQVRSGEWGCRACVDRAGYASTPDEGSRGGDLPCQCLPQLV